MIQNEGWQVTAIELRQYGSPFSPEDVTEAEIDLTVHIDYEDEEDNQNSYRVK